MQSSPRRADRASTALRWRVTPTALAPHRALELSRCSSNASDAFPGRRNGPHVTDKRSCKMIALLSKEELAQYPVAILPQESGGSGGDASCPTCEGYRPEPQRSGNLQVDPEIHLPSPGMDVDIAYREDAVGNRHTFAYASGLLSTLEDAGGRVVSFSYSGGLLEGIQDWAGRRTTFQYDTASASPKNLLTTVIGPTGCQTLYG